MTSGIKVQRQMHGKGKITVGWGRGVVLSLAFNSLCDARTHQEVREDPLLVSEGNFGWSHWKETHRCPVGICSGDQTWWAGVFPGTLMLWKGYFTVDRGAEGSTQNI